VLEESGDAELVQGLLAAMHASQADFTLVFRRLSDAAPSGGTNVDGTADFALRELFSEPAAFDAWALLWRARLGREPALPAAARVAAMRRVNPAYIPRNHWIERAIVAATSDGDLTVFKDLLGVLAHPFELQPGREEYERPAAPEERVTRTFCGT
jgi:uncharacterized protein YdiU (UPF0061 family)